MFARNCRSTHKRSFCTKTHGFKRYEKSSSSADIAVLIFRFTGIRWKMLGWLSADTDRGCEAENTLCICSLRGFSLKYTHAYKKVQHSNWLLKISDHKGLLRTTLKHCSRLFDLKWMDWTKAVRPFHLPKRDSLWQSDKREMARKTLQYGWLLSRQMNFWWEKAH